MSSGLSDGRAQAGSALYARNCQVCHGGADGAASIATGLAPNAPQLAKDGVKGRGS
jgi:mono/diheme cytochrome c family protein